MKINKWYFISLGALALVAVVVVKFVLPNLAYLEMGRNLASGDPERIAQAVDFESLRRSLMSQYRSNKSRRDQQAAEAPQAEGEEEGDEAHDESATALLAPPSKGSEAAGESEEPNPDPVKLPVPVESSNLNNFIEPLLSESERQDARVQAMLNDALSPDGIERLLNGEMTHYNDLAREVFPPHLVEMATQMKPAEVRALLQNVRETAGPDGTRIMAVDMPGGGEVKVTLRQNGGSYQIVDMQLPSSR